MPLVTTRNPSPPSSNVASTLFAEDTGLLPAGAITDVLVKLKGNPQGFPLTIQNLWRDMATGTEWSVALIQRIAQCCVGFWIH